MKKSKTVPTATCHWICVIFARLLTLMFDYGQWTEVYDALNDGLKTIQVENWLQVREVISPSCLVCLVMHRLEGLFLLFLFIY